MTQEREMLMKMKVNDIDVCRWNKLELGGKKKEIQNWIKKEIEDGKKLLMIAPTITAIQPNDRKKTDKSEVK